MERDKELYGRCPICDEHMRLFSCPPEWGAVGDKLCFSDWLDRAEARDGEDNLFTARAYDMVSEIRRLVRRIEAATKAER